MALLKHTFKAWLVESRTSAKTVEDYIKSSDFDGVNVNCNAYGLTSLFGSPNHIRMYDVSHNKELTSLEHSSQDVDYYYCNACGLTSLKHAPNTVIHFECSSNPLTSLEGIPTNISTVLNCYGLEKLTSLKGIHHQIKHIGGSANFEGCPITSHVLGLMKIKGLKRVYLNYNRDSRRVEDIINKHLKGNVNGSNLGACHDELCENNFEAYAQL